MDEHEAIELRRAQFRDQVALEAKDDLIREQGEEIDALRSIIAGADRRRVQLAMAAFTAGFALVVAAADAPLLLVMAAVMFGLGATHLAGRK